LGVARKSISCQIDRITFFVVTAGSILNGVGQPLYPAEKKSETDFSHAAPKYLGATACASSGCHGGAGQNQNQYLVWSLRDFHAERPVATLTTARSKQIADALQSKDPTTDQRCTSCHAPLQRVPALLQGPTFKVSEAISCDSCHGASEHWLRSHTRPDYSRADRVASGMRDLKNLYVRANTCVACHQTVAAPLLSAGHPPLIFELDGQAVAEPKHWLVGQAVALREMCWQLSTSVRHQPDDKLQARADALLWLLQKLDGPHIGLTTLPSLRNKPSEGNSDYAALQSRADKLARDAAGMNWSSDVTSSFLLVLAKTGADFRVESPAPQHALRAERLVLALDRLLASRPRPSAEALLNDLFKLAQSVPDFDPARFSIALDKFALALGP
jgi:hypothetical protein